MKTNLLNLFKKIKVLLLIALVFVSIALFTKAEAKEKYGEFYEIDNEYVINVLPETTYSDLKHNMEKENIIVTNDGNEIGLNDYVGSGMLLKDGNKSYKISVIADLDGNGKLTITDLIKMRLYSASIVDLSDRYKRSADINNDGQITITDLIQVNLMVSRLRDRVAPESFNPEVVVTKTTITVIGNTIDVNSGNVEYYFKIDNGEWVQNESKTNGRYTFRNVNTKVDHTVRMKVKDKAGNEKKTAELVVDAQTGNIDIIPSTLDWTNENIKVVAQYESNLENIKQMISVNGGSTFVEYSDPITITKNTTIVAQIRNIYDEVIEEKRLEITNIDKLEPKSFTLEAVPDGTQMTVTASTNDADKTSEYGKSGIKEYEFILKRNLWQWKMTTTDNNYTFTDLKPAADYKAEVIAIDNAGNRTSTGEVVIVRPQYTINYNANGGTVTPDHTTTYAGETITMPTPERKYTISYNTHGADAINTITVNYTFLGWYKAVDGTEQVNYTVMPGENITVYAHWQEQSATLPVPERTGYTFEGWYETFNNDTYTNKVGTNTYIPHENVTLHAKWTRNEYTINYNANGGTVTPDHTTTYAGETITMPTPERKYTISYNTHGGDSINTTTVNYTFLGWYKAVDGTEQVNYTAMPVENITIYAHWQEQSATIPTLTRIGYSFEGWYETYSNETYSNKIESTTYTPHENITLHAKWTRNEYTINYNANGGTVTPDHTTTYAGEAITMPTPERGYTVTFNTNGGEAIEDAYASYQFKGWYDNAAGGNQKEYTTMPSENITVYAMWESTYINLPTPRRTGYTFMGWKLEGTVLSGKTYTPTKDTTLYAEWGDAVYTLTYDANGGTVSPTSAQIREGDPIGTYPTPEKKYTISYNTHGAEAISATTVNYTFTGWYKGINSTEQANYTVMPGENVTVYAHWQEQSATIPTLTRIGYTFEGWYETFNNDTYSNKVETATYTPHENITLHAKWTESTNTAYKVIHQQQNLSGEYETTETENLTGTTGQSVTPATKTYTGFTAPSTQTVTIEADGSTEVTYKYSRNKYQFTLGTATGVSTTGSTSSGEYYYGATITLNAQVNSGYSFTMWSSSNTSKVANIATSTGSFTMPDSAITMTPVAENANYTITYNLDGGSLSTSNPETYTSQTETFTLNNPTKPIVSPLYSEYIFAGWTGSNGTTPQTTVKITKGTTGNLTFTANWVLAFYSVTTGTTTTYHDTLQEAFNACASSGSTITVLNSKQESSMSTLENKSVTIALNNKTIDLLVETSTIGIQVAQTAELTITESGMVSGIQKSCIYNYGTLNINDAKIINKRSQDNLGCAITNEGNLYIYGNNASDIESLCGDAIYALMTNSENVVKITSGLINGDKCGIRVGRLANQDNILGRVIIGDASDTMNTTIPEVVGRGVGAIYTQLAGGNLEFYNGKLKSQNRYLDENNNYVTFTSDNVTLRNGYNTVTFSGSGEYFETILSNEYVQYTVIHQQQQLDGTYSNYETENLTGTTGQSVTPATKTYEGFTAPSTQTVTISPDGSTEVTYKYSRNKYQFTLGTATKVTTTGSTSSGEYYYGETITLNAVANAGYNFTRWYSSNTNKVSHIITSTGSFTMPDSAITMTPETTLKIYTLTYNLDGGRAVGNPTTYTVETETFTLNNPTKTGYEFTGWHDGIGTTLPLTIPKGSTGNRELTAMWVEANYTVTSGTEVTYYNTLTNAVSYVNNVANSGATIKALKNVNESLYVTDISCNDVTFDTNGYVIDLGNKNLKVLNPTVLTIKGNGLIVSNATVGIYNYGTINIQEVILRDIDGNVIRLEQGGNLNIYEGASIESQFAAGILGVSSQSNVTVYGGQIEGRCAIDMSGTLIIGDSTKDKNDSSPVLIGRNDYGVYCADNMYFYSGKIQGKSVSTIDNNDVAFILEDNGTVTYRDGYIAETTQSDGVYTTTLTEELDGIYAALYDSNSDGTGDRLVFTTNNRTLSGYGNLTEKYNTNLLETSINSYNGIDWYNQRANITKVDFVDKIYPTSTAYWFYGLTNLNQIDFNNNLDTSLTTDMNQMFRECSSLTSLDLSSFDTRNVTNMAGMFSQCSGLTSLNLSSFNTGNVTNMSSMFSQCTRLRSIDLSGFNTSNVTNMSSMFYECISLSSLDLSSFVTSNVVNMSYMFWDCYNDGFTRLNLSNFDTSNVKSMLYMFCGCSKLTSLNISSFNTSNVVDMGSMFSGCMELTSLDLSNFNTSNVTNMGNMFYYCKKLETLNLSSFNTINVTNMRSMFGRCQSLTNLDLSTFNTSNVVSMQEMFSYSHISNLNLNGIDTSKVKNMKGMFEYSQIRGLDLSSLNTSNVTNMESMFAYCSSANLDLSGFNTSKVTTMESMFDNCWCYSINLTSFNTSNVTNMRYMFSNCTRLTELDLRSFNTSNVTDMVGMFIKCSSLTSILANSSRWKINYADTSSMFYNCGTDHVTYA